MKKISILISVLALFVALSSSAQVVRLGLGAVGVSPGKNSAGAQIPLIDLGYAPKPQFDLGLYSGFGVEASVDELNEQNQNGRVSGGFRLGVQGRYFFNSENTFRPYLGLQAGALMGATVQVDNNTVETGTNKFQVAPIAGFRFGPLNLWASLQNKRVYANVGLLFGFGSFK